VAVFAKPPVAGAAKTRLAPALGAEGAARLAAAFLADTVALVRSRPWASLVLATTGPLDGSAAGSLDGVARWDQGGGDLGARLERVVARGLAEGAAAVMALGADSPGLPAAYLDAARDALERHEAVLGPTSDGGFYLLALGRCFPGLLASLPWSSRETLAATRARLVERGLSVGEVSPYFDVDTPDDLARLELLLASGEIDAPETRVSLAAGRGRAAGCRGSGSG